MDYSVRSGDRNELVATLRQFQADRALRSESRRAAEAAEAAELLESGCDLAYFERIVYVVGESDRYSIWSGAREKVLAELRDAEAGWAHERRLGLEAQAGDAIALIGGGADVARVGHWLYLVRD